MPGRLKISDIKLKTEEIETRIGRLERQLLWSRVASLVAITALALWLNSLTQETRLSEPWDRTDQNDKRPPVDKTAKFILLAGMTLSFAVLVVGTALKETKEVFGKLKDRARSDDD